MSKRPSRPATKKAAAKKPTPAPVADNPKALAAHKESLGKVIRVRATQMGYIDHVRRRVGDVFDVREGEFSDRWMEVVDGSTPPTMTTSKKALAAATDEAFEKTNGKKRASASTGDRDVLS